jgi:hypothetical protein
MILNAAIKIRVIIKKLLMQRSNKKKNDFLIADIWKL